MSLLKKSFRFQLLGRRQGLSFVEQAAPLTPQ
jgi:hypothetical protein